MFPGIAGTLCTFQNPPGVTFHLPEDFIFENLCSRHYYLAYSGFRQNEVRYIH